MKTMIVATALLAGFLGIASAQTKKMAPLAVYAEGVLYASALCPMILELSLQTGTTNEPGKTDWASCINDAKRDTKRNYAAALTTIKKAGARSALKEHYIAATSAITAIAPGSNENRMSYARRQAENSDKVTERWARFEVEN